MTQKVLFLPNQFQNIINKNKQFMDLEIPF